ncbi:glycosyl hydrolase [Klebsiella aerogenes]|uniref:Cellulase n=1 Tax=Klebsiella aerogenes TaxID=548 RepID=A0A346NTF1_KLEAE|nr:glycosyl hydrolase [Klebsiella aerogenes]AXR70544.1 cellulase [Klebsiella aerogenes]WPS05085.1 cellulase family glycosylhydrolase [Klebsiella aerogenes]
MRTLKFIMLFLLSFKCYSEDMLVGVGIHPTNFNGTTEQLISLLKHYNITTTRTDYPWSSVEKEKGKYTPGNEKLESFISASANNDIKPLLILDYGNPVYEEATLENPKRKPTTDASISAFVNYSLWTVKHFGSKVSMYEIWNEWVQGSGKRNLQAGSSIESANMYAKLVSETCAAIKKTNPDKKVIIGSTSPSDRNELKWLSAVLKEKNVLSCIDGLSLHIYASSPNKKLIPEKTVTAVMLFQNFIRNELNLGYNLPLYITEIGVPSLKNNNYNEQDIKDYFEYIIRNFSELGYVKGVWWYDFINDGADKTKKEHNFGMLNENLTGKPIAESMRNNKKIEK